MKTIKLSNLIDGHVDFLDVRSSVLLCIDKDISGLCTAFRNVHWSSRAKGPPDRPVTAVTLTVWVVYVPCFRKAPSPFLLSSGRKNAFIEPGGYGHAGQFPGAVKCSPQLWWAGGAWGLAFTSVFNPQLPCAGFHSPECDGNCWPRSGRHKDLLPHKSFGDPVLYKWYSSNQCGGSSVTSSWATYMPLQP